MQRPPRAKEAPILDQSTLTYITWSGLLIGGIVLISFLILGLLALGSSRHAADDEKCFGTFAGRRHYNGSPVRWFSTWVSHMESVGKKHR